MKGMVFTGFLDMVEDQFSLEMVDEIIEASDLESEGAYTSIGTYNHKEMIQLVKELSLRTNMPVPDLLRTYGRYLFSHLAKSHSQFMADKTDVFAVLNALESHIHVEVKKLYPDAELPHMETRDSGSDGLDMIYSSQRPFADFAHGLLLGVMDYFDEDDQSPNVWTP